MSEPTIEQMKQELEVNGYHWVLDRETSFLYIAKEPKTQDLEEMIEEAYAHLQKQRAYDAMVALLLRWSYNINDFSDVETVHYEMSQLIKQHNLLPDSDKNTLTIVADKKYKPGDVGYVDVSEDTSDET